ncbi:transposase [Marinilactibacillus psychrotolerans]|uniref:Transposase n=1 Tax=Marinilactibacillus psychrotolerans TaxID=191770 RepID=A0A5R9C763_9LACT|nr:IS66 family insertion sequence element accessory protein TnpB [Marinilactibacillus psychrotolerans]TLQ09002.1 transposase [Marinilactibacillus psychrotolerans]
MKLVDFTQVEHIFIVCGKTDMRRQIDGLAATITEEYDMDIYADALFLFCG